MGNTPFEAGILADNRSSETNSAIEIRFSDNWFLPASVVADWRRQVVEQLITVRRINYRQELAVWNLQLTLSLCRGLLLKQQFPVLH